MKDPLQGIVVLDLSRLLPGPFLTMVLADLGANVIKVEDPHVGDYLRQIPPSKGGMSGRFLAINRGKRSLTLDLKSSAGRDAFLRLVERADVVVESFRPGVLDKLSVGWKTLSAKNPRLVLASISGFGQTGPYVHRAGHDLNYIALAGVLAMGGAREGAPGIPGVQVADLAGGALWGLGGILAALIGRERSGCGTHVDVSMTEGALALLAADLGNLDAGAPASTRGESTLNGGVAAYSVYRCKDDRYLAVGALEPKFWFAFNQAIGRPGDMGEIIAEPAKQVKIRSEIQALIGQKTRDEWVAILATYDCCTEPVLELDELANHPLHEQRNVFFTIESPAGPVLQVRTPLADGARTLPPTLGQHSRQVLAEFGFADDEIATLT